MLNYFKPIRQGIVLVVALLTIFFGQTAWAEYWGMIDAPDWSAAEGYTRQSWGFDTQPDWQETDLDGDGDADAYLVSAPGYPADVAADNAYGPAYFIRTDFGDSFAWDWIDEGPMEMDYIGLQGLVGGMGTGSLDFVVPAVVPSGYTQSVWIQYVAFIPTGSDGAALGVQIAADGNYGTPLGSIQSKSWEQIHDLDDQGGSGDWWRVTEFWEIDTPTGTIYVRIATADNGTANMIDSVDLITRALDTAPPTVVGTSPADTEQDVALDAMVRITFSKPMQRESVESAFSLTPELTGAFTWSEMDAQITFSPAALFVPDTEYSLTVGVNATDTSGNQLKLPYRFQFRTGAYVAPAPQIDGIPEPSTAIDTLTLSISGDSVFGYRYRLDGGQWIEATGPSAPLSLSGIADGEHTLDIEVLDSLGNWFAVDPIVWTVAAPPQMISMAPQGSVQVPDAVTIVFSEAMDQQTVEDAFDITPHVDGTFAWQGSTLIYTVMPAFQPETEYTVTVAGTAADLAGNPMGTAVSWRFTTLPASTLTCPVSADTYVLFGGMGGGAGYPQGSSTGEYRLKAGAVSIVDARALLRFDLSPLTDEGLTAADISSARVVYTMLAGTASMDVGPPAPAGTAMHGFIHVLDTTTREKSGDTTAPFFWTEAVTGGGYVHMDNKPWYAPGSPWILVSHTTGPNSNGTMDITPIVKGWLDGRWPNNGIELRDQDDRSDPESEWGDGYSWHIASREDPSRAPYLHVTFDTQRLRIGDRISAAALMSYGETRTLNAAGGGTGTYHWSVFGRDGADLSSALLSSLTGESTMLTAPGTPGLITVQLSCDGETDHLFIGVGSDTPVNAQAPLFIDDRPQAEQDSLNAVCADMLEQLGRGGSLGRILLADETETAQIGGTGLAHGALMAVAVVDSPGQLTTPALVALEWRPGQQLAMQVFADSFANAPGRVYAAAVDSGSDAPGKASGLYLFDLYDAEGHRLPAEDVHRIRLTIPYDTAITGGDPFANGNSAILQADTFGDYFSGDDQAGRTVIDAGNLTVDESRGEVTFDAAHCSVFGIRTNSEASSNVFDKGESEGLGGGCFISHLR